MGDYEIDYAKKAWELAVRSGNWAFSAQLAADYLPAAMPPATPPETPGDPQEKGPTT